MIKRSIVAASLLLTMLFLSTTVVQASAEGKDVKYFMPTPTYFERHIDYEPQYLSAALYVSDNEIWCGGIAPTGGTWLLKTNLTGRVLDEIVIDDLPGNAPMLEGIAKVGETLILGYRDGDACTVYIGIMNVDNKEITYNRLDGCSGPGQMFPTSQGLLIVGWKIDDSKNSYYSWCALADQTGSPVFEKLGSPVDISIRFAGFTTSKGCETNDGYAVVICTDRKDRLQTQNDLIYLDKHGVEQWRITLPEAIAVNSVVSAGDNIYILGVSGKLDGDDILIDQQGMILCVSSRGQENWKHVSDSVTGFWRGAANDNGCYVHAKDDLGWYYCLINTDGGIQQEMRINLQDVLSLQFAFPRADLGYFIIGKTASDLFLFPVE